LSRRRIFKGQSFSRPGFGVFIGSFGGDDDAAFEDERDAVADNIHACVIFKVPASTVIYHSVGFDVNRFYFPRYVVNRDAEGFGGRSLLLLLSKEENNGIKSFFFILIRCERKMDSENSRMGMGSGITNYLLQLSYYLNSNNILYTSRVS